MKVNMNKLLSVVFFGLIVSSAAMAESEVGDFTLNFKSHVPVQEVSVLKASFSHEMMSDVTFLDIDYDTND